MRKLLMVMAMVCVASPALAAGLDTRLDQLEYEARGQRADTDMLMRQRGLDQIDAMDRASREREQGLLRQLESGPLGQSRGAVSPWPDLR